MNQVLRFEKKFLLSQQEYRAHRGRISSVLQRDIHTGSTGYLVRSLYFDTPGDSDCHDKLDGVEVRRKLRLRVYSPEDQWALLEVKQKQGGHQLKRSLRLSREDAECLLHGQYSILLGYREEFAAECYALFQLCCYRPKAVVEYFREAFVVPANNVRVTFDREVRASESSFDLFSPEIYCSPVLHGDAVILEVKYNRFLPDYVKGLVSACERSQTSASKYCLGRSACLGPL